MNNFPKLVAGKLAVEDINNIIGYYLVIQEEDWTITSVMEVFLKKDNINAIALHQAHSN